MTNNPCNRMLTLLSKKLSEFVCANSVLRQLAPSNKTWRALLENYQNNTIHMARK